MKNILLFILLGMLCIGIKAQNLQSPKQFFGFEPGSDRMLFSYEKLIEYLKMAELNSDRLKLEEIGKSPMGKPMYIAFISSADNIANLNSLKEINKQLALNPTIDKEAKAKMIKDGKVFILGTLSMHSSEVGPSQAAPLITYELITSKDSELNKTLENVVYMMIPCHNPDGMDMIVDNYNEYKGTKYEGQQLRKKYPYILFS
ncbi:MAG: M14 family zinc carboxypeptidase [Bacteroidales bacterium]|nr:M14 family zinc carboxypeptidase [Bacteroidales bacterium]